MTWEMEAGRCGTEASSSGVSGMRGWVAWEHWCVSTCSRLGPHDLSRGSAVATWHCVLTKPSLHRNRLPDSCVHTLHSMHAARMWPCCAAGRVSVGADRSTAAQQLYKCRADDAVASCAHGPCCKEVASLRLAQSQHC